MKRSKASRNIEYPSKWCTDKASWSLHAVWSAYNRINIFTFSDPPPPPPNIHTPAALPTSTYLHPRSLPSFLQKCDHFPDSHCYRHTIIKLVSMVTAPLVSLTPEPGGQFSLGQILQGTGSPRNWGLARTVKASVWVSFRMNWWLAQQ